MVSRAEVILLEMRLRQLVRGMNVSLIMLKGNHNTEYDNPVQFRIGSNSFFIERDSLAELLPMLEPELDAHWLEDYLKPFLDEHAG